MRVLTCFDLDDTLISELEYAHSGMEHVARWLAETHGVQGLGPLLHAALEHGVRHRVFDEVFANQRVDPGLIPACVTEYRGHLPSISPYPDVDRTLTRASQLGPIALLTDGPPITQRRKLEALGPAWVDRFDAVVLTGELEPPAHKPSAAGYLAVQSAVDSAFPGPFQDWCYIGDNPGKDFLWPRAQGWLTVQIDRPDRMYRRAPPTPAHGPQARIAGLDQLWSVWPRSLARV